MKKISLVVFAISASLFLSSCANNEDGLISTDSNAKLLKNFTVKRDASGAYSMDFNVYENTKIDKVSDKNSNSSQFYLYSSDKNSTTKIAEQLVIDDSQLKVGFVDANNNKNITNVTVFDDNITLAKGNEDLNLKSYSIKINDDGLYDVAFEVKNNVAVNFVRNEKENTFEIHLSSGKGGETNFSRTPEKIEGKPLTIVFVNYVGNPGAKTDDYLTPIRKPVIIIEE